MFSEMVGVETSPPQNQQESTSRPACDLNPGLIARFSYLLARPVDAGSLALLRICLGIVMCLEAWSLVHPSRITSGAIPMDVYYSGNDVHSHFPYAGFGWLPVISEAGMRFLPTLLGMGGALLAIGLFYRFAVFLVFLVWGYLFAIESTRTYWQCHYYIELLFCFLMIWMPAQRRYSLDAWLGRGREAFQDRSIPFWPVFLVRAQLFIAYFYAGAAKINTDWLLDAAPIRWYLRKPAVLRPFTNWLEPETVAHLRQIVESNAFAYFICYAGMMFDLAIGGLMVCRRTRILGLVLMAVFHLTNRFLIFDDIDWFPLVGMTTALIFLDPDWPDRVGRWIRSPRFSRPDWRWFSLGSITVPVLGASLGWCFPPSPSLVFAPRRVTRLVVCFVSFWIVWQAVFPIRHYLIPGDGRLTFEGLSFSWRLKADYYRVQAARIEVVDPEFFTAVPGKPTRVNWHEWRGNHVIYRPMNPGRIRWPDLPEIVVALEPQLGERIIYNPFAGLSTSRTEADARARVNQIWMETYGRLPDSIRRTVSIARINEAVRQQRGGAANGSSGAGGEFSLATMTPQIESLMSAVHPFTMAGEPYRPAAYFVIEDSKLQLRTGRLTRSMRPLDWRSSPATRPSTNSGLTHVYGDPMAVYMSDLGFDARTLLPLVYVEESADRANASVVWNPLRDLTLSMGMHVSGQPFYLRRYAERIARQWELETGRRPAVHALTGVSLNRRPPQPVVDPSVDLASVGLVFWGHNSWIQDLQHSRIPREALEP